MITPRTQTAIAVLKCIYARDYGTCIKPCTLTEKEKQALLLQLSIAKFILLKDTENPLEIQSYIPARKAVEISLLDILEVNPEKPDVPLNKNDAFQKVQKRRVQEKR